MILETQIIVLVESIFFFHSSKLSFIQLLQTEMNRRTAITSLLH